MADATASQQKKAAPTGKYWEGIGRRKTSTARARLYEGKGATFVVNGLPLEEYFQDPEDQRVARQSLGVADKTFDVSVKIEGGGIHSQAEAVRHGIARALEEYDGDFRSSLKAMGFLKRDPRMRERKKFGLRRARRAVQWRKR